MKMFHFVADKAVVAPIAASACLVAFACGGGAPQQPPPPSTPTVYDLTVVRPTEPPTADTKETTVTRTLNAGDSLELIGMLKTGMMAIGGETTGTVLMVESNAGYGGPRQLELSGVGDAAKSLSGRRVRVKGTVVIKQYVERGSTPIIEVQSIEAASVSM